MNNQPKQFDVIVLFVHKKSSIASELFETVSLREASSQVRFVETFSD